MLAYVFWHWKRPEIDREHYETVQRRFHESLAEAPSRGLVGSWTSSVAGIDWVPHGFDAYEDWYLIEGSAALDPLNEAAITGGRALPHDAAATLAAGGTAGLYRLRAGHLINHVRTASWFSKPSGLSRTALDAEVERAFRGMKFALWMRQMVLGPTPEFCLQTDADAPVHVPWPTDCQVHLQPVWP
jgi:hypothetical protein